MFLVLGSFTTAFLGITLSLLSLFLILLVLVQRGRGGGLTGALGGPGGQSAFGSKAGDLFTRITSVVALVWIGLCAFTMWLMGNGQEIGSGLRGSGVVESTAEDPEADGGFGDLQGGAGDDASGLDIGFPQEGGDGGLPGLSPDGLPGGAAAPGDGAPAETPPGTAPLQPDDGADVPLSPPAPADAGAAPPEPADAPAAAPAPGASDGPEDAEDDATEDGS